ncbi:MULTISPECIES: hypothetical protein [unclassified Brevundimonas]|uniref:hypothetical protein n=1 Tax=unclassified Brevundimonas TaxID=2622653 RepID=UPI0025BBB190|nr:MULTISPECIES: hypothetical protein [unclassified Brevundimonas]
MTLRLILAASAALVLSAPVVAVPAMTVAAQVAAVTEAEMEAKTQAFEARMAEMNKELQAALDGSGGNADKALPVIRTIPDQLRNSIQQAIANQAAN